MKKIISAILALAMSISLFAGITVSATGEVQELTPAKFYAWGKRATPTQELKGSVLSWTGIQLRRYSIGSLSEDGSYVQYGAMKVTVNTPGTYNLYLKTNNPTDTSIAPLVAVGKYDSNVVDAVNPSEFTGGNATTLGYFKFSEATADEYAPVTVDGNATGKKGTVTIKEAGDYYILFMADLTSHSLNPYARDTSNNNAKVETTVEDAKNIDSKTYLQQEMYLSGIKLVPAEVTEQELALSPFYAWTSEDTSKGKYVYENSLLSWTGIQTRRYGNGGVNNDQGHAQHGAIKVSVTIPGKYNLYFKTDNPTETSVAPLIAMGKYDSAVLGGITTDKLTGDKTTLGYFKFSDAPKGKYAPVTEDGSVDGKRGEIELEAGDYYILFVGNVTSFALNPNVINTGDGNKIVEATEYNVYGYHQEMYLSGIKLVPAAEEDEDLTTAFRPDSSVPEENYNEPSVIVVSKTGMDDIESVKNDDGTHNITAPEENKNGAKFLYWAKGLSTQKRILLGETNVLRNYAPDAMYATYLIPVYADEVSGADEYYNANGQLIPDAKQETTVSMAGYGTSDGWDKYGETSIYVAHYDLEKPEKIIDIKVTGGNGTGKYAYGDTVTCTADDEDNIGNTFKCWKKNGEIVSIDKTYTFKAWEGCKVEAVYADRYYTGAKMKIIIDDFAAGTETGVMAEFLGFGSDVVEKGIMFTDSESNTTRIAMTKPGTQFSVIADGKGTYVGYAILKNEGAYTLITDGKYEKNN